MGLDTAEQEKLYNYYWHPMEQSFGQAEYSVLFNRFMRDYLTMKTGRIPNIQEVYLAFKLYANSGNAGTIPEIVHDIYRFSKYFVQMAMLKTDDKEFCGIFRDINTLKIDVAYPFLLEIFDDYTEQRLSHDEFITVLRLTESYVFRRAICEIPTNSLNKTFAGLGREINKDRYVESLKAAFIIKDSYRRFPTDEEFRQKLILKDVYNFRSRSYLLRKLENFKRKEFVNIDEYTIEHIMPQNENVSSAWQQELGPRWKEIHSMYLHTIGNLTLTGYNSELSDRSFAEKRTMPGGFSTSPIQLNGDIAALDQWNEDTIRQRARRLADIAIEIWPSAELPQNVLQRYQEKHFFTLTDKQICTLADCKYFTNDLRELFERLRKRILALDTDVIEEIHRDSISYRLEDGNDLFASVIPRGVLLYIAFSMNVEEIHDPYNIVSCNEINLNEFHKMGIPCNMFLSTMGVSGLDAVMEIVQQVYQRTLTLELA